MENEPLPITIDDSFECSPSKRIVATPNTNNSTITQIKLNPLVDALNKNFFNGMFKQNGGDIKWSDYLVSRTAAALEGPTPTGGTKLFLRMSKPLLKHCTRKQLIESLLYEMMFAFIHDRYFNDKPNFCEIVLRLVLQEAMDNANTSSGLQLLLNHPFITHKTVEAKSHWIDVDGDGLSMLQNDETIIWISDDESDDPDEPNRLVDIRRNNCGTVQFVSHKIHVHDSNDWSTVMHKLVSRIVFDGTNFTSISYDKGSAKCPLCCQTVEPEALNFHFNNCVVFRS